jgi:hypothetical protein
LYLKSSVLESFTARFTRGVGAVKPATALAIVATVARVNFILDRRIYWIVYEERRYVSWNLKKVDG